MNESKKHGLEIRTIGHSGVFIDGEVVLWRAELARTLVFYLLTYPHGRTRDQIIDALWNAEPDPITANRFRVLIYRARAALGGRDSILEDHSHYHLAAKILKTSDTHAFYTTLASTEHVLTPKVRLASLQHALTQYHGDYLPLETAAWANQAREEHRTCYVRAEIELSGLYCDQGSCESSVAALARALHADPFIGENYHQKLIIGLCHVKGIYAAIEHYRRFVAFLRSELEDAPMRETIELVARLKNGEHLNYHLGDHHHQPDAKKPFEEPPSFEHQSFKALPPIALGISGTDRNQMNGFIPEHIFSRNSSSHLGFSLSEAS